MAEDSMFPFKEFTRTKRGAESLVVKVSFRIGDNKLLVEKWNGTE
jgi:hypothetical protein